MNPFRTLSLFLALGLPLPVSLAQEVPAATPPAAEPVAPAPEAAVPAAPAEPAPAEPEKPQYDEIVVKGVKLQGRIIAFTDKSITFETIYGKGEIEIQYTDLTAISTHSSYRFIQRDGESVTGRVAQLSTRDMVVATNTGDVAMLKPENLERVIADTGESRSFVNKLRNRFPYTSLKFDLGWNLEAGAVKKVEIEAGLNLERRKAPTRLVLDIRTAYETNQDSADGSPETVSKDEYRAYFIGEYDLKNSKYAFLFPAAERDATRNIEIRAYPAAGLGYRLAETGKLRFQIQGGLAYVTEEFIDYAPNEYAALHLGLEGGYDFTNNYTVTWKTYYYPGLEDATKNWLFRTELAFAAKITEALALNLRFTDTLDNTPAPEVGDNKFTTTLNLVFTF
jgi:putative salt-induced outer membrane protein YdiY